RDPGRPVRAPREPLRRHVRRSRQRIPRRGGAGIRRGGRPDRRSAPRGAAVLRDRDPGRGEGAALHRRRRVVPGGRRPRGALRGARRARGGTRGRSRLRRGDTGADVRRGAPVSAGNRRRLPGALLTLLLAWLVLYPILVVVAEAARGDAIAAFLSRGGEWHALWASLWISLASVALAAAVGVPLAFLFEWLDFPGRKTLGSVIALPAVLPPFVGVIAFLFLYGESGFVARAVQHVLGLERAPWRLQGAGAILLVHAYSMYVYFYLFTRAGLAKLDASMLDAAQALGAGRWGTLPRAPLPLRRPAPAPAADPERRRARPRHGGRVAAGTAAPLAAPHVGPGLARPLRYVDHGGRAAGPQPGELPAPVRRARAAAAARELAVDGGREHRRRRGAGTRRGHARGPPASREDPLAWSHRRPARAAVGPAGTRLRGCSRHDLQCAAPVGAPLRARGSR